MILNIISHEYGKLGLTTERCSDNIVLLTIENNNW